MRRPLLTGILLTAALGCVGRAEATIIFVTSPDSFAGLSVYEDFEAISPKDTSLASILSNGILYSPLGGTNVFGMFLHCYDVFHLSRAPDVRLPGGRPVFPEVPTRTPEEVLASHDLDCGQSSE